jgi:hypothetical protein
MYGRADGMPSFQLTVAVCAWFANLYTYNIALNQEMIKWSNNSPNYMITHLVDLSYGALF